MLSSAVSYLDDVVEIGIFNGALQFERHVGIDCVEPMRSVQHYVSYTTFDLVLNTLVVHTSATTTVRSGRRIHVPDAGGED